MTKTNKTCIKTIKVGEGKLSNSTIQWGTLL